MYKMAIIGFGGMGSWHYANLKEKSNRVEVVGVYDIRQEAIDKAAENGLKIYEKPEDLYNDDSLDLVLVATPNDSHKKYCVECLNAGKNVISEKPATMYSEELEDIFAASEKNGKFYTVHHNRRLDNDYLTIRKIFDDNIIGAPYAIESRVQGSRRSLHGWRGYKINGGGMVLDWGIHLIDQMLNMFPQKLIQVDAHLHQVFAPEVDDAFTAMFRFEDGLTYIVNIDMNCFVTQPRWHVCAHDGSAIIENWELDGKIVKLAEATDLDWSEDIVYTAAGPTRSMAPRPKETTEQLELPKQKGNWADYYNNIADVLDGKGTLNVTKEQILRVMKTIDLVFESDEKKQSISCSL